MARQIQDLNYLYDAVGNVRGINDNRAAKVIGGVDTDLTRSFAYDPLNRLCATWSSVVAAPTCSTTISSPVATFTYDGIGNLVTDSSSTNIYFTTLSGERRIENKTGTTINWRAYHDTEGKRTRFEDCSFSPCINHYYGYDYRGRLASVTQDGVVRESYEYDFANQRTKKSYYDLTNTTHSWFIGPAYTVRKNSSDTSSVAKSLSLGGVATRTYGDVINGQATTQIVTSNANQPFSGDINAGLPQGVYIRHSDLVGTPTLITRTEDGAPVTRYKFDVWGGLLAAGSVGLDTSYENSRTSRARTSAASLTLASVTTTRRPSGSSRRTTALWAMGPRATTGSPMGRQSDEPDRSLGSSGCRRECVLPATMRSSYWRKRRWWRRCFTWEPV